MIRASPDRESELKLNRHAFRSAPGRHLSLTSPPELRAGRNLRAHHSCYIPAPDFTPSHLLSCTMNTATVQASNGAQPAAALMDIDMDLDLGPLPEPEQEPIHSVSLCSDPPHALSSFSSDAHCHLGTRHARGRRGRSTHRRGTLRESPHSRRG